MQYFHFAENISPQERRKRLRGKIRSALRRETRRMGAVAGAAVAGKILLDTALIYVF
jgi:hypothetical protein